MVSRSGLTVAKGQILVSTTSLEKRKIAGVLVCLHKYVGGAKMGRTYLTMIRLNSTTDLLTLKNGSLAAVFQS